MHGTVHVWCHVQSHAVARQSYGSHMAVIRQHDTPDFLCSGVEHLMMPRCSVEVGPGQGDDGVVLETHEGYSGLERDFFEQGCGGGKVEGKVKRIVWYFLWVIGIEEECLAPVIVVSVRWLCSVGKATAPDVKLVWALVRVEHLEVGDGSE